MSEKRHSILIVDDEDGVRNALRRALRKDPYDLHFAASGPEALEVLASRPIDMILSDHLMPGMTGLELLKIARNRWPHVMRLILTGHADLETAIASINQGEIYRFLTKPWEDMDLKVTLYLAFEHLDLERENEQLLSTVRRQSEIIRQLEEAHPGIADVRRSETGAVLISEEEMDEPGSI